MIRLFLAVTVLGIAVAPASGAAGGACRDFDFHHHNVPWSATDIHVAGGAGCTGARRVIRAYAEPRNCQFVAPCHVLGFTCATKEAHGSTFEERCTAGKRRVRWSGSYVSS